MTGSEKSLLIRRVAPFESLWTLPGWHVQKRLYDSELTGPMPLVLAHTGRSQSRPTGATPLNLSVRKQGHPAIRRWATFQTSPENTELDRR